MFDMADTLDTQRLIAPDSHARRSVGLNAEADFGCSPSNSFVPLAASSPPARSDNPQHPLGAKALLLVNCITHFVAPTVASVFLVWAMPCAGQNITRLPAVTETSTASQRLPPCDQGTDVWQSSNRNAKATHPTAGLDIRAARFSAPVEPTVPAEAIPAGVRIATTNLTEAIEVALERNPNLVTMRQAEPVSQAALGVARTYPFNPFVQIQGLPLSRNILGNSTPVYNYVLLMQTMELAHQSRFREMAGTADLTRTQWTIHQAELVNVALTERLFFAAIYQRGVRDVTLSLTQLNEELVGVLNRRFKAGQALAPDVSLARLQAHAARQQANLATATYNTALFDLRTQLGLAAGESFEPQGDLLRLHWESPPLACEAEGKPAVGEVIDLVSGRPDVMAARADVTFGRANADLARANRVPSLQAGPIYLRDDFATLFFGFRAQMDIPVVNNGMPLLYQRQAELRQRQVALEQLQNRARLEAEAALERYERVRRLIEQSQAELTQFTGEDVERVEEQYKAGQVDLLRVYAARSGLIQAQRAMLDTLNELAQAAARVTETTGLPPHVLIRSAIDGQP
jgi:outer membrane protein TolC